MKAISALCSCLEVTPTDLLGGPPLTYGMTMRRTSSDAKREQLLAIASERFLARGFAAVSVDEIVAAASQSKTNVYSWFGGKNGLFVATVDMLLNAMHDPLAGNEFASLPLKQGLRKLADTLLKIVLSRDALALHRLIVAEAPAFPDIGRAWLAAGPQRTYSFCSAFIESHQKEGRLLNVDPRKASIFFHDMLTGDVERRMLAGTLTSLRRADRDQLVDSCVDFFLRASEAER
jgi:AcrR family transcriptional regulator